MSHRALSAVLLLTFCLGCGDPPGGFRPLACEQRLGSGKVIKVTSCLLVWGVEHDDRDTKKDSFALEYVSSIAPSASEELDREALEVFELIRPISEQWGFSMASVSAFTSAERTGPYNIFAFSRSSAGPWSVSRQPAKVYNTESGRKPGS